MDAPVWNNDLLYLKESILTLVVTAILIGVCFYYSRRSDRRRALRLQRQGDSAARPAPASRDPSHPR